MLNKIDVKLNMSVNARCCVCLLGLREGGTRVPQSECGDRSVGGSGVGVSVFVFADSPPRELQI